jgi:hypothetical protein
MEIALFFALLGTGVAGIILALCVRHAFRQNEAHELPTRERQ